MTIILQRQGITIIILIIIIKIFSVHISTLLGAQGAETEKTWIQTIYKDSKNHIMCRDTCTMQLYTSLLKNCDIRWVLSSDLNLVLLWQDLSLVGRWFQSLGAATEKDLSPQVRFEVGSFRSDNVAGAQIAWWSVDFKQFRNINWSNVIKRFVNN